MQAARLSMLVFSPLCSFVALTACVREGFDLNRTVTVEADGGEPSKNDGNGRDVADVGHAQDADDGPDTTGPDADVPSDEPRGVLDPDFGDGGIVHLQFSASATERARDLIQDADDSLVVGLTYQFGSRANLLLARLSPQGQLVSDFAAGGFAQSTASGLYNYGYGLARGENDAIWFTGDGYFGSRQDDIYVLRFNADGSLDTSFAGSGAVPVHLGGEDTSFRIAAHPDGGAVVCGTANYTSVTKEFVLVRFRSDGTFESLFAQSGIFRFDPAFAPGTSCANVIALADGTLVATGWIPGGLALVHIANDGVLIPDFGEAMVGTSTLAGVGVTRALATDSDGSIYVGVGVNSNMGVLRYLSNGQRDPLFGEDSIAEVDFGGGEAIGAIVMQPNHKILIGGTTSIDAAPRNLAFARLMPNGHLDPSYGDGGRVVLDILETDEEFAQMVLTSTGSVVAAGFGYPTPSSTTYKSFVVSFE
ncbi:MAG: hypothetical protein IPK13_17130 [Deltaproteobacteria bacterium]|nr:hypothetical protein [Deltaproteobacteria bacterium]